MLGAPPMESRTPIARRPLLRFLARAFALLLVALPLPAAAQVMLTFHSFTGSYFVGRFPHTFISMAGTLDGNGQRIDENYGYTAKHLSTKILSGNVEGTIMIEKPKYLTSTNRHFTVAISDAQYHAIVAEMVRWRDAPGKAYSLDRHNCVHFVAAIAELVGIKAPVPPAMVRKPKQWLNYVTTLNPQLGAKPIK
jgi:hypothetical protein